MANGVIARILQSPMHRLLSRSTALVRYHGRRTGRTVTTPVQYARHGSGIVVLVGHPEGKTWWRNFRQGHDLEVLIGGRWEPMRGRAVIGREEPETAARLLDVYATRFPGAARQEADTCVLISCTRR